MKRIIIVVLLSMVIAGIVFWIVSLTEPNIDGYLVSYEKCEDIEEVTYLDEYVGMNKNVIDDIKQSPDNYNEYLLYFHIENTTDHMIWDLNAHLSKSYSNIWLFDSFSCWDFAFNLTEHEVTDYCVSIIIKTDSMTESEIDTLIKSIGITICAENADGPFFASNTIYFKNPKSG